MSKRHLDCLNPVQPEMPISCQYRFPQPDLDLKFFRNYNCGNTRDRLSYTSYSTHMVLWLRGPRSALPSTSSVTELRTSYTSKKNYSDSYRIVLKHAEVHRTLPCLLKLYYRCWLPIMINDRRIYQCFNYKKSRPNESRTFNISVNSLTRIVPVSHGSLANKNICNRDGTD